MRVKDVLDVYKKKKKTGLLQKKREERVNGSSLYLSSST